ncbi:ABC transporter permease [Sutcliffiella horikoshii]|uniref:ABC transporter permease n=1 Tax=Sutcliffiella horikoshii TaxID=79883 RepID=UPI003CF99BCC
MMKYLKEILKRKDLLTYLIRSGLKAEHRNSFLGYFWWLLDPLLNVLVYYFVVAIVLGQGGENYGVYLVIGLVTWRWMSSNINGSSKAITKYASIINQVYLPKSIFPLTVSGTQLINFSFGLIVIALFLLFFGVIPGWQIVFLPIIILIQFMFLLALSLLISFVCVFVRDIDNIITHIVRIMFYASPIIWEGSRIPEKYEWAVAINPVAHIVNSYRDILMYQTIPNFVALFVIAIVSMASIIMMLSYYSKNEHKIIKAL